MIKSRQTSFNVTVFLATIAVMFLLFFIISPAYANAPPQYQEQSQEEVCKGTFEYVFKIISLRDKGYSSENIKAIVAARAMDIKMDKKSIDLLLEVIDVTYILKGSAVEIASEMQGECIRNLQEAARSKAS